MKKLLGRLRVTLTRVATQVLARVDLRDVFVFSGLGAVGYGIAQMHVPTAWIVMGTVIFLLGVRR